MHNKESQDGSEYQVLFHSIDIKFPELPSYFIWILLHSFFSAGVKEIIGQKHYDCEGSYSLENND